MAKKVSYKFDPFKISGESRTGLNKTKQAQVYKEVADFVLNKVISDMRASRSSVKGNRDFKKLDAKYADDKKGGDRASNLFLKGNYQDNMRVRRVKDQIEHTFLKSQQKKADNHNRGVTLPKRQSVPETKQTYKKDIIEGIINIIQEKKVDNGSSNNQ